MHRAFLLAIGLYQKYLSPHKGFCCAYRTHTGRAGCSALGFRAVRRYGVGCEWPKKKNHRDKKERFDYIPPHRPTQR
jgi:putative component of membrane protein insertase Oxa1/YidC/SpoIIIJ protein YidD